MILLAHPSPLVLEGLAQAIRERLGVELVLRATTPERCVELARSVALDAVVVDEDIAPGRVVAFCVELHRHVSALVLVTDQASGELLDLLGTGATGISLADEGLDGLVEALRAVLAGRTHLPERLTGTVLRELIDEPRGYDDARAEDHEHDEDNPSGGDTRH